ncbi:YxeA family protein [Enterococcus sp. LJL51]|uniref:YxeA family protein n=1 Tax=Enterococcus sp. LJL51 TaxID=3416656 RepID=UPI003CEB7FE5
MKLVKGLAGLLAAGVILLGGLVLFTRNSSGELAGIVDRFNPLVSEGEVYVKTKEADEINGYGTARYIQKAADENGKTREVDFNAISELTTGKYLKLYNKGAYIETYEEVAREAVPEKALTTIE